MILAFSLTRVEDISNRIIHEDICWLSGLLIPL